MDYVDIGSHHSDMLYGFINTYPNCLPLHPPDPYGNTTTSGNNSRHSELRVQ